ncbi:zf-TFIIB domain-containing protein [Haliea sp. E17]|uniref:TFIIB-type zinc ribbon-containing protein n=1 Tax=Haliea sp. E17 TaxID=3401576 RepID=UPI003AAE92F4
MNYDATQHSLQCPKCGHGMLEVIYSEVVIDRCTHCQGLWFDANEALQLKSIPGSHLLDVGDAEIGVHYDARADIGCPRCGKPMEATSDAKQKHIWYELCIEHGMFMDAGEFRDYREETLLDWFRGVIKGDRSTVCP